MHGVGEAGEVDNDDTVWVGLVTDVTKRPLRQFSADLARREIATVGKGLPPVAPRGPRRPYAMVACDSTKNIDAIFQHLIGELRLPAVIGPEYSGKALHALTRYALPAGTVLLAHNATASIFTTTPSHGLFLRCMTSDALHGKVLALFVSGYLEPELRATGVLKANQPMSVFIAYENDAYGQGIADIVTAELRFNGKTPSENGDRFKRADFGNPDDPVNTAPDTRYVSVAADILALRPHVIVIAGTAETERIIEAVDQRWPAGVKYRPRWIGSDGVAVVAARMVLPEASFPRRFLTANPRVDFATPLAQSWLSIMARQHADTFQKDPRSPTALATYDAVYAMAYAIASLRSEPLTGPRIAAALRRLDQPDAPAVEVGPAGIPAAYEKLEKAEPFDLKGGSCPLDWDANGDVLLDIDILCMKTRADEEGQLKPVGTKPSGMYYDVRRNRFVGRIANCPGP